MSATAASRESNHPDDVRGHSGRALFRFVDVTPRRPISRVLKCFDSEVLAYLFWSDEIGIIDPSDSVIEMIHAEMNARGEGDKVAV